MSKSALDETDIGKYLVVIHALDLSHIMLTVLYFVASKPGTGDLLSSTVMKIAVRRSNFGSSVESEV